MTLEKALEQEEQLVNLLNEDSAAQEIWDMAVQLEGLTRNAGKHAGGVVIAPSQLTDFSPLFCDEEGMDSLLNMTRTMSKTRASLSSTS